MTITRREALVSVGAFAAASTLQARAEAEAQEAASAAAHEEAAAVAGEPICLTDFEPLAKARMQTSGWEYLNAGAGDELTTRWNKEAYRRMRLKPRVLVGVEKLDTRVTLFGQEQAFPIMLAPVAAQSLAHHEAELGTVRGASAARATMVLSSFSSTSLEDVAAAAKTPLWFQLYAQTDHGFTRELVQRAEAAGYRALCLTVDTPVLGARNREGRAKVKLPTLPNLKGLNLEKNFHQETGASELYSNVLDAGLSWKDVEWLLSFAKVPLLLKGVLNPDDAEHGVKLGVGGIMVSNHGGRNLDTLPATAHALPLVAERVAGRVPVVVDGGIRRGTDVLKALALGANAVMIGRSYVYGLGAQGEAGVAKVLSILQLELMSAMALTGRTSIAQIDRSVLWPEERA